MWFFGKKKKQKQLEAELIHKDNLKRIDTVTQEINRASHDLKLTSEEKRDITRMIFKATGGDKR